MKQDHKGQRFFRTELLKWNDNVNTRQMPWKGERDPYKIWISEIILQQTRVEQGWDYYLRFIKTYPGVRQLANAADEDVFKLWEGLGYYSRCRNLLSAARQIVADHDAVFPQSHTEILALKGVGPYTAAAIASFAFDLPFAVVDGNVTRVLSRFFGISTPFDTMEGRKLFAALAQQLISTESPSSYNQAIMDFGATICKPAEPLCRECPLSKRCVAFQEKRIAGLPVRSKKIARRTRWFCYWIMQSDNDVLVRERTAKDIWQHLNEFFLIEGQQALEWSDTEIVIYARENFGLEVTIRSRSGIYSQQLTHQTIHARFVTLEIKRRKPVPGGYEWLPFSEVEKRAFPKIINTYREKIESQPALLF